MVHATHPVTGIDNPVQSLAQGTIEELLTEVKVGK